DEVKWMSLDKFQKLITNYVTKTARSESIEEPRRSLTSFQRHLEHIHIYCKISRAACEKLEQLRKEYSNPFLDMSLVLGTDVSESESFNPEKGLGKPLIKISTDFLNGRLPFLHEWEGKPTETSVRVAPVLRSRDAVNDICGLRNPD